MIKEGLLTRLKISLEDGSTHEWECAVQDVYKDRLALAVPTENPEFAALFTEGADISVGVFSSSGVSFFDSIVISSGLDSDFVIEYCDDCPKINRRKYKRAYFETKVLIERLTCQNILTSTIDIGGGSYRFTSDTPFRANEWVNTRLRIPLEKSSVRITGTIIKKAHLLDNEYILLFNQVTAEDREMIIKSCDEVETLGAHAEVLGL